MVYLRLPGIELRSAKSAQESTFVVHCQSMNSGSARRTTSTTYSDDASYAQTNFNITL